MPTPSDDSVQQPVQFEHSSQATCPPDSSRSGDRRMHETVSSQQGNAPSVPSPRRSSSATPPIRRPADDGARQEAQGKPEAVEDQSCPDAPSPIMASMGCEGKDGEPSPSLESALVMSGYSTMPSSSMSYKTSDVRVGDDPSENMRAVARTDAGG
jgi:hypothetical protein